MKTYWFGLTLESSPLDFDDLAEATFEAGCDDGTVSESDGVTTIGFAREAESLETAIRSAIVQVESVGCVVARVEIEDLATLREVA